MQRKKKSSDFFLAGMQVTNSYLKEVPMPCIPSLWDALCLYTTTGICTELLTLQKIFFQEHPSEVYLIEEFYLEKMK